MKKNIFVCICFLSFYFSTSLAQKYGVATHFDSISRPYGGCGVSPDLVESENYVALNVFSKPNIVGGTDYPRPILEEDKEVMGEFNNGLNCGRWVKVTILDDCVYSSNSVVLEDKFCSSPFIWKADQFSGAELYMIVTDACGDNNPYCRQSKYHLDIRKESLNKFKKNGEEVSDMYPTKFNNRKIVWDYVTAPNYTGDIKIHFLKDTQRYWASITITNLQNGIHKVEQKVNGNWVTLKMNSDMGQAYLLSDFTPPHTIRIYDANDKLINDGREYKFENPCYTNTCTNIEPISYQKTDCYGVMGGNAIKDSCGTCAGGTTNIIPILDKKNCSITNINLNSEIETISFFPNPTNDRIYISSFSDWTILSITGKTINVGTGREINMENLPNGMYVVQVNGNNYKIYKN